MRFEKFNTQDMAGMSLETLRTHYHQVKEQYVKWDGRDVRTQAYLSVVDGWIQKLEQEEAK